MPQYEAYELDGETAGSIRYRTASGERHPLTPPTVASLLAHNGTPGGVIWLPKTATSIDHGGLAGLADDDHSQYPLLAGGITRNTFNYGTGATADHALAVGNSNASNGDGLNWGYAGQSYGQGTSFVHYHAATAGNAKLFLVANGTQVKTFDNNGVLSDYNVNRTRFKNTIVKATSNASQTISTTAYAAVNFAAEEFDTDTLHDTTTNNSRLLARLAGYYMLTGGVYWDAQVFTTTTFMILAWRKNGTTIIDATRQMVPYATEIATNGHGMTTSGMVSLAANDYVELCVYHDKTAAGTLTINNTVPASAAMVYLGE